MLGKAILKAGLCAFAGLGLFVGVPASAKEPQVIAPSADWRVSKWPDKCRLSRNFGEGKDAVYLALEKGGVEPTFNLIITGKPIRNPVGQVISVQFGPKEQPYGRNYLAVKMRKGKRAILMYGASFAISVPKEDGGYTVEKLEGERLAAIEYLQIERAGLKPFRLPTGDLTKRMAALRSCTQKLAGALAVASAGQSKAPQPLVDFDKWLLPQDYPAMMVSYERGALITYRLTVGKNGKPTFCTIVESTTPQMFDDAVCLGLLKRAKFSPALDLEGEPALAYWIGSVRFLTR